MRRWLGVGGCSWHVAPRPCVEGKKPRAGVAPFYRAEYDHAQCGTARARRKLVYRASSRETESAGAPALRETRGAGLALKATAGTSHHGHTPKERCLSSARRPSTKRLTSTTSAPRRPCVASLRAARPPCRQRAQVRLRGVTRGAGLVLEAAALTRRTIGARRRRAGFGRRSALLACICQSKATRQGSRTTSSNAECPPW